MSRHRLLGLPQGDGSDWLLDGQLRRHWALANHRRWGLPSIRPARYLRALVLTGPAGLRAMLAARPEVFVGVMTEKLMTYALGRGLEYYDMPAIRKIVGDSKARGFPIFRI